MATKLLTVRSPKTAHHAGHAVRMVPVSKELQPILSELKEMAKLATKGDELLFPMLVGSSGNLRTTFHKIIERAGHKPWPRLFQNLRGSCETDLVVATPSHTVASWFGHSPTIAAQHYMKHIDLHFQAATGTGDWIQHTGIKKPAGAAKKVSKKSGAECGAF